MRGVFKICEDPEFANEGRVKMDDEPWRVYDV